MAFVVYKVIPDHMKLSDHVDPKRCLQLVIGVAGIYIFYLATGVIHESMLTKTYENYDTKEQEKFSWAAGFLVFPCGICYIIGAIINKYTIPAEEQIDIPLKNSAICGVTVAISTLTYTYAIYMTNFPVVMMFKSCNILSVILVGIMCSRVKDKKLKLGIKKLVVGIIVTLGILVFKLTDPGFKTDEKKTELMGIALLLASLMADGFLPDFQAQIKSEYKPKPMQMMVAINKWVTIIAIVYSLCLGELWEMLSFIPKHHLFFWHLLGMGILSTLGQIVVYWMIKEFKQHFVPFVITTRKIFTVGLSIIFYDHPTNIWQILGLITVFGVVTYEFVSELMDEKKNDSVQISELTLEAPKPDLAEPQLQPASRGQEQNVKTDLSIELQEEELYKKRMTGEHAQTDDVNRPAFQTPNEEKL